MKIKAIYRCSECGREFKIEPGVMLCPDCKVKQSPDEPLRGILEVEYYTRNVKDPHMLLPVEKKYFPDIPVGNTPLMKTERLGSGVFLKNDTVNLTGSYKDRASILVAAFARKFKLKEIVLASTGNAGSSMSGVGAAGGLKVTLFLPEKAPRAKMVQALQYGANVVTVDGNYDKAFDLSMAYSEEKGLLSRNTAYNPLTIEGKKTAAFEIVKQLGKAPDQVFVPTGDGVILSGIYKGFRDLLKFGFIKKMPMIVAVQAKGSSAIHDALKSGTFKKVHSETVADSIAVDVPRCGYYALKQLRENKGQTVVVSDNEILHAQKELSEQTGLFAEPAAAASYAGYLQLQSILKKGSLSVLLITGTGLKDIDAASKGLKFPEHAIKSIGDIL